MAKAICPRCDGLGTQPVFKLEKLAESEAFETVTWTYRDACIVCEDCDGIGTVEHAW